MSLSSYIKDCEAEIEHEIQSVLNKFSIEFTTVRSITDQEFESIKQLIITEVNKFIVNIQTDIK
jgi:hypothetical protein